MSSLVSIIIPTYNRAYTIQKSVDSILTQTYQNFEIIIIDDGSEDDTENVINGLKKKDSRIHYIRQPHRKGANVARNRGVSKARGKYIAFQDSDDQWLPHKLFIQMDAINTSGVGASFTSFWRIQGQKSTRIPKQNRKIKPGIQSFHQELLKGNFITLPTFVVEKSLFYRAGEFDEELSRFQDWELFLRLSKLTDFIFIDQPLVNTYLGTDNITQKKDLYRTALEFIIKKHHEDFIADPAALIIQYLSLAIDAVKKKEYKRMLSYIGLAFRPGVIPVILVITQKLSLYLPCLYNRKSD